MHHPKPAPPPSRRDDLLFALGITLIVIGCGIALLGATHVNGLTLLGFLLAGLGAVLALAGA